MLIDTMFCKLKFSDQSGSLSFNRYETQEIGYLSNEKMVQIYKSIYFPNAKNIFNLFIKNIPVSMTIK